MSASDETVRSRVDERLEGMTTAEKAAQLTQYFYFGFQRDTSPQPGEVEAALRRVRRARC